MARVGAMLVYPLRSWQRPLVAQQVLNFWAESVGIALGPEGVGSMARMRQVGTPAPSSRDRHDYQSCQ